MASADNLEGDAVELVGLALLVVLAVVAYGIWKGDPAGAVARLLKQLWNAIDGLFSSALSRLQMSAPDGGPGVGTVYTGSNLNNPNDTGSSLESQISDGFFAQDSSPAETLDVSQFAEPVDSGGN